jgi:hypothetical protein
LGLRPRFFSIPSALAERRRSPAQFARKLRPPTTAEHAPIFASSRSQSQAPRRTRHTPASFDKRLLNSCGGSRWRHHRGNFPARKSRSPPQRFTIFARRRENVSHMRRSRTRPGRGLRRAGPSSISLRNSSIHRSRAIARCAGEPYEMRWKLPQQCEHIGRPSLSLRRRTRLSHRGHRKKLQDPPFGKRRCASLTSRLSSITPKPIQTLVILAVILPSARSSETLGETGRVSSNNLCVTMARWYHRRQKGNSEP